MLPKANRLIKESEFKKVAKGAKPIHSKYLILKKVSTPEQETAFGLVISTKVSKKAVVRNKIRRRLREVIRDNLNEIVPGFKVMLVVKSTILDKEYKAIKTDLEQLLKKVRLI